jgi:hypothetical protein
MDMGHAEFATPSCLGRAQEGAQHTAQNGKIGLRFVLASWLADSLLLRSFSLGSVAEIQRAPAIVHARRMTGAFARSIGLGCLLE